MMQFTEIILIALFVEAIVNALKPIWAKDGTKFTISEYVSMLMGILLAVSCKINMLAFVAEATYPIWVEYIFYVLTGVAIGRGTNFLYDLWNKLKEWQNGNEPTFETATLLESDEAIDVNIDNWSLEQIIAFANANGFNLPEAMPSNEQEAKYFLIECLFGQHATALGNGEKYTKETAEDVSL